MLHNKHVLNFKHNVSKGMVLPDFQFEHRNINYLFSGSNSDNLSM